MPKNPKQDDAQNYSAEDRAAMARIRRKVMWLMSVSLLVTIALVAVVMGALLYKKSNTQETASNSQRITTPPPAAADTAATTLPLPAGARILSHSLSGNLVSLVVQLPDGGNELLVYDYQAQNLVARLRIPTESR